MLQLRLLMLGLGLAEAVSSLSSAATTWARLGAHFKLVFISEERPPSLIVLQFSTVHNVLLHLPWNSTGMESDTLKGQNKERESLSCFSFPFFHWKACRRCIFFTSRKGYLGVTKCAWQVTNLRQKFHRHLNQKPGSSLSKTFPKGFSWGSYREKTLCHCGLVEWILCAIHSALKIALGTQHHLCSSGNNVLRAELYWNYENGVLEWKRDCWRCLVQVVLFHDRAALEPQCDLDPAHLGTQSGQSQVDNCIWNWTQRRMI